MIRIVPIGLLALLLAACEAKHSGDGYRRHAGGA